MRLPRFRPPEPNALLDLIDRMAPWLFCLMAAGAFIVLLYLGRHSSFHHDEWTFIQQRTDRASDWLAPHNEHWSTVPLFIHRALLASVGLASYLPYLAVLLALHVVAAAGLFASLRRPAGPLVALAVSAIFLFLGSGGQNLFWAFQIGFVCSAAAGVWALVAFSAGRPQLAALLLILAVASSAMGLPFVAAGAVMLALDRDRRRQLIWLAPVAVVFVAWFLLIGRAAVAGDAANVSGAALARLPAFVAAGALDSVEATLGPPRALAAIVALVAIAWAGVQARARAVQPLPVAALVGLIVLFVLVGLGRGQLGVEQVSRSRYLYFGAIFVLLALVPLVGRRVEAALHSFVRSRRLTLPLALAGITMALAANGFVSNVQRLPASAQFFGQAAGELRAYVMLAEQYGPDLQYRPPPVTRVYIPAPVILRGLFAAYGSPMQDALVPSVVRPPTPVERDRALWDLTGGAMAPQPVSPPTGVGPPPAVTAVGHASLSAEAGCLLLHSEVRSAGSVTFSVAEGSSILITVNDGGDGFVRLGRDAPPSPINQLALSYPPGAWLRFDTPRQGDGSVFGVQLVLPGGSLTQICGAPG